MIQDSILVCSPDPRIPHTAHCCSMMPIRVCTLLESQERFLRSHSCKCFDSTAVEKNPIRQRHIFAESSHCASNHIDKENEDNCNTSSAWLLGQIINQSQELDMTVVQKEAEEDGEKDLNCSTSKVEECLSSFQEAPKKQCEVEVFEYDNYIVCNTAR
jgi:hypothetical protein